jgi:hypothetical protein
VRAARYGSLSPEAFDEMDFDEAAEFSRRATLYHQQDMEAVAEMHTELTKALLKAQGANVRG